MGIIEACGEVEMMYSGYLFLTTYILSLKV